MSFFEELKRRNVIRMAVLYLVVAWLSLQVTDVLSSLLTLPDWAGSLVVMLLVLGLPLVLILSWVYEITPEGFKRETDANVSRPVSDEAGRKINTLTIGLLVLTIATVALDRLMPDTATVAEVPVTESADAGAEDSIRDRSIAVLPFANRSAKEEDRFFVDGIHDDILTQLAHIGPLTVISRTSVEKFRGTTQSIKEIGDILGVRHILEGGVQRAGDRVRINMQLIDAVTDDHLWAETYDRELTTTNIFGIQSEVSTAIANALKATLSPEEENKLKAVPTESLAALEAYFLGKQSVAKRTGTALADGAMYYKKAIELDPGFALAYLGLADSYAMQSDNGNLAPQDVFELARPLIDKALELDAQLPEAYAAQGQNHLLVREFARADTAFRRSLALSANDASTQHRYSMFLRLFGQYEEGLKHIRQAAQLDPLSSVIQTNVGTVLTALGRPDEAIAQFKKTIEADAAYPAAYWSLGGVHWTAFGQLDEALPWLRQALDRNPGNSKITAWIGLLYLDLGDEAEAERWVAAALERAPEDSFSLWAQEMLLLYRGESSKSRDYANQVLRQAPGWELSLTNLANQDMRAGAAADARARYEVWFPDLFNDDNPQIDRSNVNAAIDLGAILGSLGQSARARLLLDNSLAYVESTSMPRLHWYPFAYGIPQHVQIYAVQGEAEKALRALRQAVDQGWRAFWWYWLKHDPKLDAIRGEPEFQAILREIETDMAAQLLRVRALYPGRDL